MLQSIPYNRYSDKFVALSIINLPFHFLNDAIFCGIAFHYGYAYWVLNGCCLQKVLFFLQSIVRVSSDYDLCLNFSWKVSEKGSSIFMVFTCLH